ncbi:MAG: paraquat-inducible protein A [Alphaproteobacteria bacterium]|jgi:paraquat-inducible protein A|nr:paraquat-inducible protein A [Alphaproteobacteria bacterium]MDP6589852.1 paraquat-inducible protein A [Alphaproteobacteria bacterium]|tara:strand:+ start:271 stop:819 length:549 start_codon:yes stop_codon:yes gene_type:complete
MLRLPAAAALLGARDGSSLAARARGADRLLGLSLFAAAALLVVGWLVPIMTVRRFLFFEDRISVLQALEALLERQQYLLFFTMLIFSMLLPLVKIFLAWRLWRRHDVLAEKFDISLKRAEILGRWSMLDVFLMAIAVAAVNLSLIADVHLHWGLYALSGGVLLSLIATTRMSAIAARIRRAA